MEIRDIFLYVIVINQSKVYSRVIRTLTGSYNSTIDRVHGL